MRPPHSGGGQTGCPPTNPATAAPPWPGQRFLVSNFGFGRGSAGAKASSPTPGALAPAWPPFAAPSPCIISAPADAWPTTSAEEHAEMSIVARRTLTQSNRGGAQEKQWDTHRGSLAQNLTFNRRTVEEKDDVQDTLVTRQTQGVFDMIRWSSGFTFGDHCILFQMFCSSVWVSLMVALSVSKM